MPKQPDPRELLATEIAKVTTWSADGCIRWADGLIAALAAAGFAIVPNKATMEMARAGYNDGGISLGGCFAVWSAMVDAAERERSDG